MRAYRLDSSAIIHLASMRKSYSNSFGISVTLTEEVCPFVLKEALSRTASRFPTIAAGIRRGFFSYRVVPAEILPDVRPAKEYLAYMPPEMMEDCAMRVLYKGRKISVELFHSLTDGYGGLTFTRMLVMEYLSLKCGVSCQKLEEMRQVPPCIEEQELRDDLITYGSVGAATRTGGAPIDHRRVYRLPGLVPGEENIHVTTGVYDLQELRQLSHGYHVSLTEILTAVMAVSIIELEKKQKQEEGKTYEPIQIMVPVNLRTKFESRTLRNFSLYALPSVETDWFNLSFEVLMEKIHAQLTEQFSREFLAGMIATNVRLQEMPLVRCIPLGVKEVILRVGYHLCGEQNSCLTLSNLGEISFPSEIEPYIERAGFLLSPRRNAPYNCGVASCKGKLYINFSRRCEKAELEPIFFRCLAALGCSGMFEEDGMFKKMVL